MFLRWIWCLWCSMMINDVLEFNMMIWWIRWWFAMMNWYHVFVVWTMKFKLWKVCLFFQNIFLNTPRFLTFFVDFLYGKRFLIGTDFLFLSEYPLISPPISGLPPKLKSRYGMANLGLTTAHFLNWSVLDSDESQQNTRNLQDLTIERNLPTQPDDNFFLSKSSIQFIFYTF